MCEANVDWVTCESDYNDNIRLHFRVQYSTLLFSYNFGVSAMNETERHT